MSGSGGLTRAQSLIWAGQQLHPDVPLYNMVMAFHIEGPVDPHSFETAFDAMVSMTDAMRTVFADEDGAPRRMVLASPPARLELVDLSEEQDPEAAYASWAESATVAPFDLSSGLYRSALVTLGENHHVWFLAQHHLITDGGAIAVVYQRMQELYREAAAGAVTTDPDRYPSYEAYVEYEERFRTSDAFAAAERYWDATATETLGELEFYGVPRTASGTTRTDRITVALGTDRMQRLEAVSSGGSDGLMGGVSQFNLLATALLATLARVTGETELAILAPAHNRPSPKFKQTDGLFIEVLPLRVDVAPDSTFRSLLDAVGAEAREFLLHARPGTSNAASNRASSVLLNFINASLGDFNGWPMSSAWLHPGHGDADHDVRVQVHDFDGTGELILHFDLSRDIFDEEREAAFIRHFFAMFDALLAAPDGQIGAVDLLTDTERSALAAFNDTAAPVGYETVLEAFAAQVSATPDAVAVTDAGREITYAQLDTASTLIAQRFVAVAGPRPRVGIRLHRSAALVEAVWAILKAGGSYVPIDMQYPPERVKLLLEDSNAAVLVTDENGAAQLGDTDVTTMLLPLARGADVGPAALPAVAPHDTAYVMYTSGSTGTPKGVVVTHANLANYVSWAQEVYGRGGPVSFPFYSSFGFDLTVTSLFVPLVTGGTIVVYPEPQGSDLSVRDVFADDLVDVVKLTPAHLALLDGELLRTERIRTLILGGEDLKTAVAQAAWRAANGRLEILNEYGPTEATVGAMLHRYDPETDVLGSVPIGAPAANTQIHVLTAALAPVPIGVVGELCIGGAGVAAGYLDRGELTAERFVPDPASPGHRLYRTGDLARWIRPGVIEFLGRADDQVKVRGYRIELGEIEAALADHAGIAASVVDVVETETERTVAIGVDEQCARCGLTSRHPDADIDAAGVCQPCRFYDQHREHAEAYFGDPAEMAAMFGPDRARTDAGQDCVMLLSGGKDSTYALYQLVEMGLTPLVFSLDNGFISDGAKANIGRAVDDLGLELVMGTTPAMNEIFADSLALFSNVCQGCFKTVYTLGMNLAHERGLHHVVTGLSRGQIFETRLADLFRIGITERNAVDDAIVEARRAYHRVNDAVRRTLDTSLFDDDATFEEIRIVDFYRYHDVGLDEIYGFLATRAPWVRPGDTGRSTNCLINNTGIFVHTREKQFHNYALPYSWDVRLGHKTKEAALAELDDEIDVDQVRRILDEVGYDIDAPRDHASALRGRDRRIVAYYLSDDHHMTPAHVRTHLSTVVPEHAVPSYIVHLDELPLTVNGKVDRDALPDPRRHIASDDEHYVAPRTSTEETLVDVWETVLGVDRIGVHDRFIELGGDSILNIQAVALAKNAGLAFTPQQLFEHQTIANLAEVAVAVADRADAASVGNGSAGNGSAGSEGGLVSEVDLSAAELDDLLETFGE